MALALERAKAEGVTRSDLIRRYVRLALKIKSDV
jgi:hypothetical protein